MEEENYKLNKQHQINGGIEAPSDPAANRPEAVVRALQILEVREQLGKNQSNDPSLAIDDHMNDENKKIMRDHL